MTIKKNPDYSTSAVKMLDALAAAPLRGQLAVLAGAETNVAACQAKLTALDLPEMRQLATAVALAAKIRADIKADIDKLGSYQDTALGWYAVKQARNRREYSVAEIEQHLPQYAPAVVVKIVDVAKVEGLLKGGLITEADRVVISHLTPIAPAYIIRASALGCADKTEASIGKS